jgi:aspartyl-tRNA(Asn)/glutamyl-tRNA(Gln) amidotransferase subunit A
VTVPQSIAAATEALRNGEITSVSLVETMFRRADRLDAEIGVYIHRSVEEALEAAAHADDERGRGIDRGSLQGIPVGVKDIFATRGAPTTAQSGALDASWGDRPEGTAVTRLREAGAVVMGKVTTAEFAIGLPDPSKPFPIPRNPWDTTRWAGGSSSGCASGLATLLFLGALGTDTAGSIRVPSSFCGTTGLKPTTGLIPLDGVVPLAASQDHAGPMARTARDCAILLEVLTGGAYTGALDGSLAGMRVGVERAHHTRNPLVDPSVAARFEEAAGAIECAGARLIEIDIEPFEALNDAALLTCFAEGFAYHAKGLRERWSDYGDATRITLALGALFSAGDYIQAQRVRRWGRRVLAEILEPVDVLLVLTAGVSAPPLEGLDFFTAMSMPVFTPIWDGVGLPAMSVPIGFADDGMPVGMTIVARAGAERTVLCAGDAYQRLTDWHDRLPPATEGS